MSSKQRFIASVLFLTTALHTTLSQALDVDPGDCNAPPPGMSVAGLYYINQKLSPLYAAGQKIDGPELQVDVGVLRFLHSTTLGGLHVNPQMAIPVGRVRGQGSLSGLQSASGLGDLFVAMSVMLKEDQATRTSIYVMPGMTLKTGAYDRDKLSFGNNRLSYLLQLGAQTGLSENLTVDGYAEVSAYGDNKDYAGGALAQRPVYLLQGYLRYALGKGNELALGLRHYVGGRTEVSGAMQSDGQSRSTLLLNGSSWLSPSVQLMASYGRDMSMDNGFKTRDLFQLRLLTVF